MLAISKVFTSLSTLPFRGIARKKEGLFAVDKQTYLLKLSLTWVGDVSYFESVHHPIPTLSLGIEITQVIFKTNQ